MNHLPQRLRSRHPTLIVLFALHLPSFAHAHVGVGPTSEWTQGFAHPISGLDHICAMVAVGLWAAQRGGQAIWLVPLTFVTVMAFGAFLGRGALSVPFIEEGTVLSVLVFGVLIVAAARLPLAASFIIVALFAVFHGHSHGAEMPATASSFAYGAGFTLATALLHAFGIGVARLASRLGQVRLVRYAGVAIALCGVYLWFA